MIPERLEPATVTPKLAIELHPAWRAFMRFCKELQHGEIDRLMIQDGVPVLAETTKKKVKFKS